MDHSNCSQRDLSEVEKDIHHHEPKDDSRNAKEQRLNGDQGDQAPLPQTQRSEDSKLVFPFLDIGLHEGVDENVAEQTHEEDDGTEDIVEHKFNYLLSLHV